MEITEEVRSFYNGSVESEWNRIAGRPEFLLTARFLDRYVMPGEKVLDIGGGPGRYSLHLAKKGCDVTLLDLSDENVRFAKERAKEQQLSIKAVCGDARYADSLVNDKFDHVLLMGPMYHLLDEGDRVRAMNAALGLLKPGGLIYVSFISMYSNLIYMTKYQPDLISSDDPAETAYRESLLNGTSYAGDAFTKAFFAQPREALAFMDKFPLEKLHFFGQEGIMTLNEDRIYACSPEIINSFVDISEKLCEREELLSWSEHLMYIGRKTSRKIVD